MLSVIKEQMQNPLWLLATIMAFFAYIQSRMTLIFQIIGIRFNHLKNTSSENIFLNLQRCTPKERN